MTATFVYGSAIYRRSGPLIERNKVSPQFRWTRQGELNERAHQSNQTDQGLVDFQLC